MRFRHLFAQGGLDCVFRAFTSMKAGDDDKLHSPLLGFDIH
jgi:hypothetical protein